MMEEGWWILTSRSSRSPPELEETKCAVRPGAWKRRVSCGRFWFCASPTQNCQGTDFWCFQIIQFVVICHGSQQKMNTLSFYHHHFLTFQQRTFYCSKNKWPEIGWKRWKQAGLRGRNWRKNLKTGQNKKFMKLSLSIQEWFCNLWVTKVCRYSSSSYKIVTLFSLSYLEMIWIISGQLNIMQILCK